MACERERIARDYRRLLSEGKETKVEFVLEQVGTVDEEIRAAQSQLADEEAHASEWAEPSIDSALDSYNELVAMVRGRIDQARGTQELNAALREVLAAMYIGMEDGTLRGEFRLRRDLTPETDSWDARWDTAMALGRLVGQALADEREQEVERAKLDVSPWHHSIPPCGCI